MGASPAPPQCCDSGMHLNSLCHTSGSVLGSFRIIAYVMLTLPLQISCPYGEEETQKRYQIVCTASLGCSPGRQPPESALRRHRRLWVIEAPRHIPVLSLSETFPGGLLVVVIFSPLNHPRSARLETGLKTTDFWGHQLLKRHQMEGNILVIMFPVGNSKDF